VSFDAGVPSGHSPAVTDRQMDRQTHSHNVYCIVHVSHSKNIMPVTSLDQGGN